MKGAVLHDIVRVAGRRCPTRILVAPAAVQGADAASDVVRALEELQSIPEVDVVIVARGGGASEDLMAFNDEALVRAIAACRVPVVSAVGHEVDVTLSDLVADVRASTPSQAAEFVVQELATVRRELSSWQRRATSAISRLVLDTRSRFDQEVARLERSGREMIVVQRDRLGLAVGRLEHAQRRRLQAARARHLDASQRLERRHPQRRIQDHQRRLQGLEGRLARVMLACREQGRHRFVALTSKLHVLSPLGVLARGYAVVVRESGGLVSDAATLRVGEGIDVRVAQGRFRAQVVETTPARGEEGDGANDETERAPGGRTT